MPTQLLNLDIEEMSIVTAPANAEIDPETGQKIARARIALWKSDVSKGVKYLVTDENGKGHLPFTGEDGKPDHHLMGAAYAALTSNHRGQPYEGPDKAKALERLRRVYDSEGLQPPASKGEQPMTLEQINQRVTEQEAEIAALKAERDASNAAGDAAAAERDVLKAEQATLLKLSEAEQKCMGRMTAEQKKAFLAADPEKRKAMVDEQEAAEKKEKCSKVENLEAVTKAYDEKLAKRDEQIAQLQAENAAIAKRERTARFVTLVKSELPHTTGTDEAKAEDLMKAADVFGGEESEGFKRHLTTLKQADAALASKFVEKGSWGGGSQPVLAELDAAVQEISKRDRISVAKAHDVLMTERPELYKRYRDEWDRKHTVRG